MKYLIIVLLYSGLSYLAGYTYSASHAYEQQVGPPKAVALSKARYFFVGYSIANNCEGNAQWMTVDGNPPQKRELYDFMLDSNLCGKFEYNELVITGLHEFKNKAECDYFFNAQNTNP